MKPTSFKDYMNDIFGDQYTGTKDGWETAYDIWSSNLDTAEVMEMAEAYGQRCYKEGQRDLKQFINPEMQKLNQILQ
jgi:hypothetical protein